MIPAARRLLSAASHIVTFSGAGLSAESGVPTFRDAQTGLWAKYDPMTLASSQGFASDPAMVIDWYSWRRRVLADKTPNPAHLALAARPDIVHITQNVDDLLERAGAANVIHLHGSIARDRCHAECGYEEAVDLADPPARRDCPTCGAPMRPGVVWFGEQLPERDWQAAQDAAIACDLMLVIGTSAAVHPAAGLIQLAKSSGARVIIINTRSSDASHLADLELLGPAGEIVPNLLQP